MKRSLEKIEKTLVDAFLKGSPPPGSHLQSERDLAARFAVSRATVREALLHLEQSGWISIQQRHATVVNDFWSTGDLNLLSSIDRNSENFPMDLALHILEFRVQFAPDYARKAVESDREQLLACLSRSKKLTDSCNAMSKFDWELHLTMAILSGNKIYPLIMNTFASLYHRLKKLFFANEEFRRASREFYSDLLQAVTKGTPQDVEEVMRCATKKRLEIFRRQVEQAQTQSGGRQDCGQAGGSTETGPR